MSSAGLQASQDIITLLKNNWNAKNTDNLTPNFVDGFETDWSTLNFGGSDQLYVKNDLENIKTGIHADTFYHSVACTIEVMTARAITLPAGRQHFKKLIDETMRIIKANARQAGYAYTVVTGSKPRFVRDKQIFLAALEIDLLKVNTG